MGFEWDEGMFVFSNSCPTEPGYVLSCQFPGWQGWGGGNQGQASG